MRRERIVDVLVVGAGPAGLATAAGLAAAGVGEVEVVDRERQAGGIPRHCLHGGFGRPGLAGPQYAERCVAAAVRAGATLRTGVTVTGWAAPPRRPDTGAPGDLEGAGPLAGHGVSAYGSGAAMPFGRGAEARYGADTSIPFTRDAASPYGLDTSIPLARDAASPYGPDAAIPFARDAMPPGTSDAATPLTPYVSTPLTLDATTPGGLERITARAVVLATGARERPRAARLVPGTRPAGVFTTGELQQAVHLHHQYIGRRAVVIGAEPVGFAALDTLRRAGVTVAALVTEHPRHQAPRTRALEARLGRGVPLLTNATVTELLGRGRLSGVRLRHRDGRTAYVACDTVVFTGDFVPDHELARRGGLSMDPGTRGPAIDADFRADRRGVFAVGNVLHAAEPARAVAREGALAAAAVRRYLFDGDWPATSVPLRVTAPLAWVAPNRLTPGEPASEITLCTAESVARPTLLVTQDGRTLHRARPRRQTVPNRPFRISGDWTARVDPTGGAVRIALGGFSPSRRP
ncbi:NAD(P)/FAD-dependent oxidoreductase [Streptomyces sp. NPDC058284]|uniref:NAD(P)/FAD-dependent oxidoreductase n=1 Tax=unclassified Streptomyces TaxID=2593676 RepID=UPI0036477F6C